MKIRKIVKAKLPFYLIVPTMHFMMQWFKREFQLSALIPLYIYVKNNIDYITLDEEIELQCQTSSIIFSVDKNNHINLITGWKGNRKKR